MVLLILLIWVVSDGCKISPLLNKHLIGAAVRKHYSVLDRYKYEYFELVAVAVLVGIGNDY